VRRGTRVAPEEVLVPDLGDLLSQSGYLEYDQENWIPLQLRSEEERLTLLLRVLGSDTDGVRAVEKSKLVYVLALRWVIRSMHKRARENPESRERQLERWTRGEAAAFVITCVHSPPAALRPSLASESEEGPAIDDRNIQLIAQLLAALEAVHLLAQALLLSERVLFDVGRLSGSALHAALNAKLSIDIASTVPGKLWATCTQGLEEALAEDRRKRAKKDRQKGGAQAHANGVNGASAPQKMGGQYRGNVVRVGGQRATNGASLFGMLADMQDS